MTCQEFRALVTAKGSPANCTLAERSAGAMHFSGCPACQQWEIDTQPPMSAAEDMKMAELAISDHFRRDPESQL